MDYIEKVNNPAKVIQNKINASSNKEKARWLENYIKHGIQSKGVGIPEIREIVKKANVEYNLTDNPLEDQILILNDLMKQPFTEDKLAAIIYLQLYWKKVDTKIQLDLISEWFDNNWITDWNVCDWLCVRILTPLVDNSARQTINELSKWNKNKNLWKARASLVSLAQCKTIQNHTDTVYHFSTKLIKREERFSKTAVGWVLREYSKVDKKFVTTFLNDHKDWTTQEVIKNATKYS